MDDNSIFDYWFPILAVIIAVVSSFRKKKQVNPTPHAPKIPPIPQRETVRSENQERQTPYTIPPIPKPHETRGFETPKDVLKHVANSKEKKNSEEVVSIDELLSQNHIEVIKANVANEKAKQAGRDDLKQLKQDFDLRKAVIYKEILDRKYF